MPELDIATLQKKVRRIEIVSNRLVSERVAGEYHSVFKGQGIEFEEVRPYSFGDEIRSIDWNVTARAGAPHVKRYREEREMTVFFVVDLSGSCQFGTRGEFKSEKMAEICAVLALAAIANNDRVGMLLVTDRLEKVVPPRKGRRHVLRLIREVLGYEPEGDGTDLAQGLDHLRHVLHHRSVVFLISDFLAEGYEKALAVVARRHDLISIAVEDPMERSLPNAGLLHMADGESGRLMVIDTSDPALRRRFEHEGLRRRNERQALCRRHEIDLIELSTDRPYEAELVIFFRRRARRLSR
jgi:uncharacterized protein (DUF58 family)